MKNRRLNRSSLLSRCSIACISLAFAAPVLSVSYGIAAEDSDHNGSSTCSGVTVGSTCIKNASHDTPPAVSSISPTIATSGPDIGLTHDTTLSSNDFNECAITSGATSAPCFGKGEITGVHTAGSSDGQYQLARLDSGVYSGHAIDLYGICRYVDKSGATNQYSIVVPFGDLSGWKSFTTAFASTLSGKAAANDPDVNLSYCVRGGAVVPPAVLTPGDARNNMCGSPQLQTSGTIVAPYRRYASGTYWNSPSVTYKCKSNADGSTPFTETVTGTYLGTVAGDSPSSAASANLPTSWSISSISTSYNGVCGVSGAPSAAFRAAPTSGLCAVGTASSVTTANNLFSWTCSGGSDGNNSLGCTAKVIVDATCGTANNSNFLTAPASNLCADGSTPTPTSTGSGWTWTCLGTNGGNAQTCTANQTIDGACGGSNGAVTTSAPSGNLCSYSATTPTVIGTGPWSWTCTGSNGGKTDTCSANLSAACGNTSGVATLTAPAATCASGTPSSVSGTGPWSWVCNGSGGHSVTCSAPLLATANYSCNLDTGSGGACYYDGNDDYCTYSGNDYSLKSLGSNNYQIIQTSCSYGGYTFSGNAPSGCDPSYTTSSTVFPTPSTTIQSVTTPTVNGGTLSFTPLATWTLPASLSGSCSTSTNAVNGSCGSDNGASLATTPTHLCSLGNPSTLSGTGPWNWSCSGYNGGAPAYCSATAVMATNGACGSANGANYTTAPSGSVLCNAGTASTPTGSGPWNWTCAGLNHGIPAYCSANLGAACGSANGGSFSSAPSSGLCASGTASTVNGSGPWSWTCSTSNGSSVSCSSNEIINGVCGSANGVAASSAPSTNLCSTGTASTVTGSGPWSWTCSGGSGANCSATKIANISVTRGQLHWDGNWTGNHFWCDSGYNLVSMHYDQGSTNNANWYECQGQVTNAVIQSGSVPVVGVLHWDGNWTGNHFSCDPGYNLVSFHYDCGCSNNSDWYECQGTVNPNNYTPLTGPTHWDGNWTGNNFWCDGGTPFSPVGAHYDCGCTNNATWYSCQVTPVAGQCGNAANTYTASAPTSSLCSSGSASNVSQSGLHYNWSCSGTYGAAATSCQTPDCPSGYVLSGNSCVQQVCGTFAYTQSCVGGSGNWQDCDIDNCGNVMDCYPDQGCS